MVVTINTPVAALSYAGARSDGGASERPAHQHYDLSPHQSPAKRLR